ncbi:MAG TPA: pyridoxal 5'-phosphate synthase glutaminase subunit PdxT [candidate division Zixibacteria bacterium]|nr:pyridoxal 5'-phosphate synthase glutaminase subunit PdxT [candidate division Zixibacteria bacterium]MDD4916382.1 pyridoxal 5'-phosphate synthase glutaminase subunit PdxT [candidate division Zixibacteria bacterium]MDM7972842.1 pyridoxal 5'-phosphate synthase glutaminase subunit PdxT [candidate division Zixibacteria bacterium]HOD67679.1 pyridoxal 5'-phosphate synthase glutaminase subunit PdxT [candidate division Zixibacteria bacterium]HPC12144.1 pyridoxal 5'-phosphate synthase glutaminase subu
MSEYGKLTVGVLALQGDFERHLYQLRRVGAKAREVRRPADLEGLDGLIMPGGESTTMNILMDRFALREPLRAFAQTRPVWGTCAGMIMAAREIEDNQAGVRPLGLIDITVVRNGYGRQVFSFEAHLAARLGPAATALAATFIRAPRVTRVGPGVTALAEYRGAPVLVAAGRVLASSFHTELGEDTTLVEYFLRKYLLRTAAANIYS